MLACIVSYILGNEWSIKFTGLFYISVIVFVELYFLVRYELAEPEKDCRMYPLYDAFEDSGKNNHRNRLCM